MRSLLLRLAPGRLMTLWTVCKNRRTPTGSPVRSHRMFQRLIFVPTSSALFSRAKPQNAKSWSAVLPDQFSPHPLFSALRSYLLIILFAWLTEISTFKLRTDSFGRLRYPHLITNVCWSKGIAPLCSPCDVRRLIKF